MCIQTTTEPGLSSMTINAQDRHGVVIVGAGFGGLWAVKHPTRGAPVDITLIDQRNHHLFQPLLYQVATASLAPSEIAWPVRSMLRDRKDVTTILATVTGVDAAGRTVRLADESTVPYDTLILATGARHGYFGHDDWEAFAPGLKTVEDATAIRGKILTAFEEAERETDPARQQSLLTFAIVGAGPTGVELAGTIADLAHDTLPRDFRTIDTHKTKVRLVEGSQGPERLSRQPIAVARSALEKLGVEVILGEPVTSIEHTRLRSANVASTHTRSFGLPEYVRHRRLNGSVFLRTGTAGYSPDRISAFLAMQTSLRWENGCRQGADGSPVPGIAPAAKQEGAFVAKTIRRRLAGVSEQRSFHYHHEGSLAQIGKRKAVIDLDGSGCAVQSPGGCGGSHTSIFSWECALASASHSTGCGSTCATSEVPGSLRKQYASRPSIDGPLSFL